MNAVIHPYLNFGGNCREALEFYAENLGGKVVAIMIFGDAPPDMKHPDFDPSHVMYGHIQIGDGHLMGSDAPNFQPMRSAYVMFGMWSIEEAERVYNLLKEGGEVLMPMAETFFAHRFAMLRDRFGVSWMLIYGKQQGPDM